MGRTAKRPKLSRVIRSGARRYPKQVIASLRRRGQPPKISIDPDATLAPSNPTLAAAWLGHASVLLGLAGRWALVDPVFSMRIGPRVGGWVIGLGRERDLPAIATTLPTIDVIFITHAHFDHLDKPTLRALADPTTVVVTPHRTARLIPSGFGDVIELAWDEPLKVKGLDVTAIRPHHWGARLGVDRRRGYNAYVIEGGAKRVFAAGDTASTDAFDPLEGIDLAALGIGAYEPWWHVHATPEQVWEMFNRIGARRLLPIHHSTFPLSDEHPDEPLARLLAAAGENQNLIVGRELGELWQDSPGDADTSNGPDAKPESGSNEPPTEPD